ncbi:hypothetical protein CAOG_006402 [Capsaspora owczarzaki ATCC 30864]|uniref:Fcf2 pre-rRNA processing C-terminal domain-containing protein n=3 Tax=Capsaspora owczarzaki (strain ATCC 30864) TaxID=595528 RepID=A0A0D2WV73_CAPO3|nr:hypothetical protein CAOG_006402 [Capsaspora owczarzaki ATCC 30864]
MAALVDTAFGEIVKASHRMRMESGVLPTALDAGLGEAQGTQSLLDAVTQQSVAMSSKTRSGPAASTARTGSSGGGGGTDKTTGRKKKELKWGDLPVGNLTPEVERDLRLLRMRNYLDPKKHFKGSDSKALPKHFQIARVVEGPTEFYSSRLTRKERKNTLVDELMADDRLRKYHKRKFVEIEQRNAQGRRGHVKRLQQKRKPAWMRK